MTASARSGWGSSATKRRTRYGYMNEYEIARLWRDSRVQRIYAGSNEVMKEIVGRALRIESPTA